MKENQTRRELDFRSADEVIADIHFLQECGYKTLKNWNLTQICEHLTATMDVALRPSGKRAPWILRATIFRWFVSRMLKTRRIMSGAPTLKQLIPQSPPETEDREQIEKCIAKLREAESYPGPIRDYPLLDDFSVEDWKSFMWLHAAHHLSFLVPKPSQ